MSHQAATANDQAGSRETSSRASQRVETCAKPAAVAAIAAVVAARQPPWWR